ncbi:MAG: gliding motility lipoprotein GldJ [Cyclobacteriaceae bacterium]|nr:gliding motility lipoprotein GldJ [Cyclobacteriaceae bacterium HetDA_MAG_MS6]
MKKIVSAAKFFTYSLLAAVGLSSCFSGGQPSSTNPLGYSTATGLEYNVEGGFQVNDFAGQPEGPNLIFIEGGRTVLGSFEEDIIHSRDNIERAVTVASFYMDETEVANIHWLEYEYFIKADSDEVYWKNNLPDTSVWAKDLAYNDPYVDHYYRYPGFRFFPVVGVNWRQAVNYCRWRTAVVNYKLAEDAGLLDPLNSDDAFAGAEAAPASGPPERIPLESGVVLPNYRLPTEAEWEYAAQALIGTQWLDENQTHRRLYPWDGHALRNPYGKSMGYFLANFKRGRGDYAGIAGKLNDGAMIPTYIYDYPPNDFGLYNMAGNVNEWVQDVYRPLSFMDMEDMNPVRRDGFLDEESGYDGQYNFIGNETQYSQEDAERAGISPKEFNPDNPPMKRMRVYKGGSWADVAYWMSPGTRRAIFEDSATSTIGFRCAMIRAGTNY